MLPGAAAVRRLVDAALPAGRPEVAQRGHVSDVGVLWMDDDPADVPRLDQPQVRPGLAAVGGAVDAVPPRRALPVVLLAGARPDDVGVGGRDGDVAEGAHRLVVEDRRPGRAFVRRLPDAAGSRRQIDGGGIVGQRLDVVDAATGDGGPDGAEAQLAQQLGAGRLGPARRRRDQQRR